MLAAGPTAAGGQPPERPDYRVLGGGPADFSQWPFAAAILYKNRYNCTGSVISPRHVLTAAHCARGLKTGALSVITGRFDLRDLSAGQVFAVASKFVSTAPLRHDLAVLALAGTTSSPAVPIATDDEDAAATAPGSSLRLAGWGATTLFHERLPGFLKATTTHVVGKKRCFRPYGKSFKSVAMICARGARLRPGRRFSGLTSPCAGDSGGPLVADTPGGPRLVGVTSFGPRLCGDPFAPVVYSRVADDLDFIAASLAAPL
jgi:secreted trypsin-like serine protease